MLKKLAIVPLMLCLAACNQTVQLKPIAPPAEKLVCADDPPPPSLDPLPNGDMIARSAIIAREAIVARFILAQKAVAFDCRSNLKWVADFVAGQE